MNTTKSLDLSFHIVHTPVLLANARLVMDRECEFSPKPKRLSDISKRERKDDRS